jgi:hypothetical protein
MKVFKKQQTEQSIASGDQKEYRFSFYYADKNADPPNVLHCQINDSKNNVNVDIMIDNDDFEDMLSQCLAAAMNKLGMIEDNITVSDSNEKADIKKSKKGQ